MANPHWRRPFRQLRIDGLLIAAVVSILAMFGCGLMLAQAAGQVCRDISNITVCADQQTDVTANGGGFILRGNVRIGPKGQLPVVQVGNTGNVFDGTILDQSITTASYFHFNQADHNTGTTDFLLGEVRMINDPTGLPLLGTSFVTVKSSGETRAGRLFVDPVNRRIFNPATGAVPVFTRDGITRNSNYRLAFVSRVGALSFYQNGGSVDELAQVNGEFDLNTKTFKGTVPINLKLNQPAENPKLQITMRATFSSTGAFTGSVDGFKMALAGLRLDASGMTVTPATATTPASFQASLVKVLKADNPNVPALDPTNSTLIFSFTNLKYAGGKFEIGGGEVAVNDWEFGNAFKMIDQSLGIVTTNNVQSLQIKSTLAFFGDTNDPKRKVPITLLIGRTETSPGVFKPVFSAGLQSISPKIGTMTFKLQGAVFSGSTAENFWGIKATSAALQWPPALGGQTAAGVNDFRLGIELDANQNKKLKFSLGSGTVSLPPFQSKVFVGTLGATVGTINDTMVITGTGTFTFALPNTGNSAGVNATAILRYGKNIVTTDPVPATDGTSCRNGGLFVPCPGTTTTTTTVKETELKLSGFNIKLAGFGLNVTNPRGLPDGGFAADNVAATLPAGIAFDNIGSGTGTNGITIQGLSILGDGTVQVQGGGFEIAPIKFGGYQFVGLKGVFASRPTGGYEFKAGGKLPLPGIEPGANSGGIGVEVRIRTKPDNSVDGFGVTVEFTSGGPIPKIKLPGTGMSIASVSGSFDLDAGQATIAINVKATSDLAIPLGSLGSLPIVTAQGNLTVQPPPVFKMSANASLSVLVFQVAQASVNIGQGYGFNGGSGLDVSFTVNTLFIDGSAHLKVGEVTLSNGTKKIRVQGDATAAVVVPAKIFAGLPREDQQLLSVTVGFGQYTDTRENRQSAGLLAMGSLSVIGTVGGFLDMGVSPIDVIFFKDSNRFQPVPSAVLRQRAATGVPGYRSVSVDPTAAFETDLKGTANAIIQTDSMPYNLSAPTRLLMGIEYTGTLDLAQIRLETPGGTILTKNSVNGVTETYVEEGDANGGVLMFVLQAAPAGMYQLHIDNPPAVYTANALELNQVPVGAVTSDTCSGPVSSGVTVTCNGAGSNIGQVTIDWSAADIDSPGATVDVGYVQVVNGTIDNTTFTVLATGQALGTGSTTWSLKEVPSGDYRAMIEVSNTSGPPVRAYGSKLVHVVDNRAPAVPSGLAATALANELSLTWTQNSEHDLAGYEVGMGVVEAGQADSTANFFYTRSMGPKELVTTSSSIVDGKLWGIPDGVEVFYGMRAYDYSGNYSEWTPLLRGTPWALSPNTWTPTPNGSGANAVEVAFDTPMQSSTLQGALEVRDASGALIPGTTYFLTNDTGDKIIGLGFDADVVLSGRYTATLKGGTSGVAAEDGRTMGGNYTWSFTITPYTVVVPLLTK